MTRPEPNPFRPVTRNGQFQFQNNWGRTNCGGASYEQDVAQATTNLFYQHNRIHGEYCGYGFHRVGGQLPERQLRRGRRRR